MLHCYQVSVFKQDLLVAGLGAGGGLPFVVGRVATAVKFHLAPAQRLREVSHP